MKTFVHIRLLVPLLIGVLLTATGSAQAQSAAKPPVVVELFTSQGCSSCPPADAYLAELIKRPGVIGLSFHVDYWDYIGWPDKFALKDASIRQHAYKEALMARYVYTPQLIVDGHLPVVASKKKDVDTCIAEAGTAGKVLLTARQNRVVEIPAAPTLEPLTIWHVAYDDMHTVRISAGENRGRTLRYVNIVRAIRPLGKWTGSAQTVAVPQTPHDQSVVLLQAGMSGRIVGAVKVR